MSEDEKRNTYIFYHSYITMLEGFSDEVFRRVITAIDSYSCDREEPDFKTGTIERGLFEAVRLNIESNRKRYDDGKKGGRPPKTEKPVVKTKKPVVSELKTSGLEDKNQRLGVYVYDSVYDSVSESEYAYASEDGKVSKDETNKNQNPPDFIPPSKKAVHGYIALKSQIKGIKPDFDEDKFLNYYNARGWMSGNTKITDWKAAVDSWLERSGKFSQSDDDEDPFANLKGSF